MWINRTLISLISNWKNKVDELNIGKLETTPVDLSKLSDVVKNEVVKKTVYMMNWLKKVNAFDTSGLVKK